MPTFLTAEWRKLAMANYIIDPEILKPFLPYQTELDFWEGKCYISLVGFMFLDTKILGVKVPGHVNFEEVNLRFYVRFKEKNEWKRGVVFIKEIVPKRMLSWVANFFYKENYNTMPMRHNWMEDGQKLIVSYKWKKQIWHELQLIAEKCSTPIQSNSKEEFITEHYWGYAKINQSKTNEYEVLHPRWQLYELLSYKINVNFGMVYGNHFTFLNSIQPAFVCLAEGSAINVKSKKIIR